ncbi:GMC oxidoreductase [Atlantibacter sp.]|uniref:GMC oxidoreductase n=1 Tax=Atlantibacter sp. TaxID=1903473 RepID=UPI0039183140
MRGTLVTNPLTRFLHRIITVHPLGGCPMGNGFNSAVVGHNGKVFNYPNLFIVDGSIMPAAVGSNPV